jgi:hypothetical protein
MCRGAGFDRRAQGMVWAWLRQLQIEWERQQNPARPRLYDLDHIDSQCPCLSKAEMERRWTELMRLFE